MTKPLDQQRKELEQTRKQMQQSVIDELAFLERRINLLIDVLIPLRDGSKEDKQRLRYITRKAQDALGHIHLAQDRLNDT